MSRTESSQWDLVADAVAERVRTLRLEQGLSQEGLARLADVSNQTVYRIESGQWSPGSLEKVAIALQRPVFELLERLDFRNARKGDVSSTPPGSLMGGKVSTPVGLRSGKVSTPVGLRSVSAALAHAA